MSVNARTASPPRLPTLLTATSIPPRPVTALSTMATVLDDVGRAVARRIAERVPRAELDERDPDYIRDALPGLWLLATIWHRAEVRGLDRIPETGPVLLVGNHSGGNVPPDTFIL